MLLALPLRLDIVSHWPPWAIPWPRTLRVFALTAIADSSHVHWQQNECTGMPEKIYLVVQFHFLGQTLKNANC
jgi:hypothetical protein